MKEKPQWCEVGQHNAHRVCVVLRPLGIGPCMACVACARRLARQGFITPVKDRRYTDYVSPGVPNADNREPYDILLTPDQIKVLRVRGWKVLRC